MRTGDDAAAVAALLAVLRYRRAMANLADLGVKVERGKPANGVTEFVYTLPKSTKVEASFAFEGLTARMVKIFQKEVQTGDALFDEHVHIKTETADETSALLESMELRAIIEGIVSEGGAVEIDGATVKVQLKDVASLDTEREGHFLTALLG
jgi:hypothetical protein